MSRENGEWNDEKRKKENNKGSKRLENSFFTYKPNCQSRDVFLFYPLSSVSGLEFLRKQLPVVQPSLRKKIKKIEAFGASLTYSALLFFPYSVLEFLYQENCPFYVHAQTALGARAAASGNLQILKFVREKCHIALDSGAVSAAARHGREYGFKGKKKKR